MKINFKEITINLLIKLSIILKLSQFANDRSKAFGSHVLRANHGFVYHKDNLMTSSA